MGKGHLADRSFVKYKDAPANEFISAKGLNDVYWSTNAVLYCGGGIKDSIANNISLMTSDMFNHLNSELLNMVHNYNTTGESLRLKGMYSDFKIGLFYNFGTLKSGRKNGSEKNKSGSRRKESGRGSKTSSTYLPFSPWN